MPQKIVTVSTRLDAGFRVECQAGSHAFVIDQPASSGGQDAGPTPLEYYLASIAGCISSIGRIVAKQKNIALRSLSITTKGDINTDVLLGKVAGERAGFQMISLEVQIDADLSQAQKEEFLSEVERRCPVSENTVNQTAVMLKLT